MRDEGTMPPCMAFELDKVLQVARGLIFISYMSNPKLSLVYGAIKWSMG